MFSLRKLSLNGDQEELQDHPLPSIFDIADSAKSELFSNEGMLKTPTAV